MVVVSSVIFDAYAWMTGDLFLFLISFNKDKLEQRRLTCLPKDDGTPSVHSSPSVFAPGLGLFGSPEDASLLDEAVYIAVQERRPPGKRKLTLQDARQGNSEH